jgi:gas vesicle protein
MMSSTKTLLAFIAGASAGALAGLLLAPEKGWETRKRITDKTGDLAGSVKNSFSDFIDQLKNIYTRAEGSVEETGHKAKAKMSELKNEAKNEMGKAFS